MATFTRSGLLVARMVLAIVLAVLKFASVLLSKGIKSTPPTVITVKAKGDSPPASDSVKAGVVKALSIFFKPGSLSSRGRSSCLS